MQIGSSFPSGSFYGNQWPENVVNVYWLTGAKQGAILTV
jgi:hypothetical protein